MSTKDLKFFMKEELKTDEVKEVPGLKTFCDDKGNPIPIQIRALDMEKISEIRKNYTVTKLVVDERGKRIFDKSGKPIYDKDMDNLALTNRLIVEAVIFPPLKDEELMNFYDCKSVTDMPMRVFKRNEDYAYVSQQVLEVCGLSDSEGEILSDDELINEAKN